MGGSNSGAIPWRGVDSIRSTADGQTWSPHGEWWGISPTEKGFYSARAAATALINSAAAPELGSAALSDSTGTGKKYQFQVSVSHDKKIAVAVVISFKVI